MPSKSAPRFRECGAIFECIRVHNSKDPAMYHIEVTCDARPIRVETANSLIEAVATVSHYVARGTPAQRQVQQLYLSRELPRSIKRDGAVSFEAGAVVVTVSRSH